MNSEGAIEDVPRGSQSLTEATGVQASVLGRRILQGTTPQKRTKLPEKRRSDRGDPMIIVQKALKLKVWFKTLSLSLSVNACALNNKKGGSQ